MAVLPELTPSLRQLIRDIAGGMHPPPKLTLSEWADRERRLSSDTSASPGRWRTDRFEPLRGVMDSITHNERTCVMKAAQLGFTEIILNACGYYAEQDPSPILVVLPNTSPMANDFSDDRLAPMIRDTPCLAAKFASEKTRDTKNKKLNKNFPGGNISMTGANSPTGLRSKPKRIILFDEVDGYGLSSGHEGDPILLGTKRAANFWNRRIVLVSTPTIKGLSRIEKEFEKSDKRYFYISCPHCDFEHNLKWSNVKYDNKDSTTARFICPNCTKPYSNAQKNAAVKRGRWIATAPWKGVAGFHISELYSPWRGIPELVNDWLESEGDNEQRQVFINTVLGELWTDGGAPLDEHALLKRCEPYNAKESLPDRTLILTAGVDTHPDRLEIEVVGWAAGEESWSIDYHVIEGDPDIPEGQPKSVWDRLTAYLRQKWESPIYGEMVVEYTCIDTGGANTQSVYGYVRRHKGDNIFGVKGKGGEGIPIIGRAGRGGTGKKGKIPITLYMVGTDQAKAVTYRRLRLDSPGSGYCHFPSGRGLAYFQQLTAEKIVTTYIKGFPKRHFECPKGTRNEALDVRVYAFAALTLAGVQWDKLAFRMKQRAKPMPKRPKSQKPETVEQAAQGIAKAIVDKIKKEIPEALAPPPEPEPTPEPVEYVDGEEVEVVHLRGREKVEFDAVEEERGKRQNRTKRTRREQRGRGGYVRNW